MLVTKKKKSEKHLLRCFNPYFEKTTLVHHFLYSSPSTPLVLGWFSTLPSRVLFSCPLRYHLYPSPQLSPIHPTLRPFPQFKKFLYSNKCNHPKQASWSLWFSWLIIPINKALNLLIAWDWRAPEIVNLNFLFSGTLHPSFSLLQLYFLFYTAGILPSIPFPSGLISHIFDSRSCNKWL